MTLYHFGNCLALVYVPYHMVYKYSGISEYGSFSKCIHAGGLYIFTQLCKMLLLATFFPDSDSVNSEGEYDIFMEFLKATVDFADLVGLYFALSSVPGKGHAKILTAALGWASAEAVVTRSVMLWVGARGSEFEWKYVRACGESSSALVWTSAVATLLWLWSRSDLPRRLWSRVLPLLVLAPYRPLLDEAVCSALQLEPAAALAARAVISTATALAALAMYADLSARLG